MPRLPGREPQDPFGPPEPPRSPLAGAVRNILEEDQVGERQRLRAAVRVGREASPEAVAEAARLAARFGLPASFALRNREALRQRAQRDDVLAHTRDTPALASWLQAPGNAGVARDDVAQLGMIERAVQLGTNSARALGAGALRFNVGAWGLLQLTGESLGLEDLAEFGRRAGIQASGMSATARGPQTGAGDAERAFYSGFESLGLTATAIPLAVSGGGAPALLGVLGGVTGGESYAEARSTGVSVPQALTYGLSQAAIEVATERIPASFLLKDLARHRGFLTTLARQGIAEVPGEQIATHLQDLNRWAVLNPQAPFSAYLEARPSAITQTLIATLTAVGGQAAIIRAVDRATGRPATQRTLEQLGAAARDSTTRTRGPDQFGAFVDQAAAGGPLEAVHLPVEPFTTYFQSKGLDPVALAERLTGDRGALSRAQGTGEDLVVPIGRYAAEIAGSEHNAFFAREARFDPDTLNAREEAALEQQVGAEASAAIAGPETATAGPVREAVSAMLEQAGVEPTTARSYAGLYESAFATMGTRAGVDPVELFNRYGLTVQREGLETRTPAAPTLTPIGEETDVAADVPASQPLAGETPARRDRRRGDHYADVLAAVLRAARAVDPTVDADVVREEFAYRRDLLEEQDQLRRDDGRDPIDLLRAIAANGGLGPESAGGLSGELRLLAEGARFGAAQGVPGVFRAERVLDDRGQPKTGLGFDVMVQRLQQDPRFAWVDSPNTLLEAIDDALRQPPAGDTFPGTSALESVGIVPGTAWWADSWRAPAAVTEFHQSLVEQLAPAAGPNDSRAVPFPTVDARTASTLYRAADRTQQQRVTVPLSALVATQATISAPIAEAKRTGAQAPPVAVEYQGRYYLVDGTHRATAALARGDQAIDVLASPVVEDRLTNPPAYRSALDDLTLRQDRRGRITFAGRQFRIDLLKRADLSTFLHESAHFYFEVLGDVVTELEGPDQATLTETQRRMRTDYQTVLGWLGADARTAITEAQHEQFARGFEAYLLEGKAPSAELRSLFARVRAWLVSVYRSVRGLQVQLTPEVRAVLDRLLATDAAIEAAQHDAAAAPLFTAQIAAAAGLSPEDLAAYRATVQTAQDHARDTVQAQLLRQLQRERAQWWRQERRALRVEVARAIGQRPVYRALALLQRGTNPDGTPLPPGLDPFKLSQEALVDEYGAEILAQLPRPLVYARRGGVPPSIVAESFGFPSGRALLEAILGAPPIEQAIEAATDARMRERHGDLLLDGALADVAQAAVLDAGAEVFAAELQHLERLARRRGMALTAPPVRTLRAIAERRVAAMRVRDLRPALFAAAARRAGQRALEAAGRQDFAGALQAKQQQTLNAELYRAATATVEAIDTARTGFRAIFRPDASLAPRYNMDLVNAARAILGDHGLATPPEGESALAYLQQVHTYDPETHADLTAAIAAASQPGRPWRDLTVEEFTGLRDAVQNMWHLARRSQQVTIDGQLRELSEVRGELQARLRALDTRTARAAYKRKISRWEETQRYLLGWRAALRRVEHWVDAIDGGDPRGVFRRILFTPITEAASAYRVAKKATLERYLAIVQGVEPSLTAHDIAAPELEYTFTGKAELLHALLHTGNESNLRKLLLGAHDTRPAWGALQQDGTLDTSRWDRFVRRLWAEGVLTKVDYDYLQGVWDLLEATKPDAQRVHHELYGFYFSEITARELPTPFGTYRGGYVPAIYDPFLDDDAARRADKEAIDHTPSSFMFPTTGRGFTMARVDEYVRPLMLDLRVLPMHLDKVLRFIHLQPVVKDAGRLVINKRFRSTLAAFDPTVAGELLVPWLQRAARQTVDTPAQGWGGRGADRFFRALRRRTGMQIMVGNVVNALQQVTGLSLAAVKVPVPALTRALWRYVRGPRVLAEAIDGKSAFMRTRTTTQTIEIQATIDDLLLNPSTYEQARAFATRHGYFLQQGTQNVVDLITWSGAYDVAVGDGATDAEAVRQADAAVRQTQGSFNAEDLSNFETGTPLQRAFTMFFSYFNMQANLLGSEFATVVRELGLRAGAGRLLYVYVFGFLIPAVLSELLVKAGSGDAWDEDEDGVILDDLLVLFVGAQRRTATAMVPVAGAAVNAGINLFNDRWYDDRISVSPAVSAIESAVRAPHSVYEAVVHDGRKKTAIRDTLTTIGLLTGLPTAPLGRPLGYLADVAEGRAAPTGPVDAARGLVVGR